jgi:sortase A
MTRVRTAMRAVGEVLITLGLVLLLFVAYQLFWTNVRSQQEANAVTDQIARDWRAAGPDVVAASGAAPAATGQAAKVGNGVGFARMWIPRLGKGWVRPVVQGISLRDLAKGIGHYPQTQLPGQLGNFAVAGHRATNGEPFRNLDRMRPGDPIVVETKAMWFTYVVTRAPEIVAPTRMSVLLPVPNQPGARPTEKLMTLTTCNPRWASYQRMIVYTELRSAQPKSSGRPAALGTG